MSNQYLKLRRSNIGGRIPSTSSIDFGEIALNTYDGVAYMKKSGSNGEEVVPIGSSTGSFTGNFTGTFTGSLQGTSSQAISASYAPNLYNSNGTLTGNRLVDIGNYELDIASGSYKNIEIQNINNTGSVVVRNSLYISGAPSGSTLPATYRSGSEKFPQLIIESVNRDDLSARLLIKAGGWHTSTWFGAGAMDSWINSGSVGGSGAATQNDAFGYLALNKLTTGFNNTAFGGWALADTTTGTRNVAVGLDALWKNVIGSRNTGVGNLAGRDNISGSRNIYIGDEAGLGILSGSNNIIIGRQTGLPAGLSDNIIISIGAGTTRARSFETGNWLFQNGGTFIDSGYRLDVNGTLRAQGALTISTGGATIVGNTAITGSLSVSGSGRFTNGLTVTGSLNAPIITGSLFGTSSWAISSSHAATASFAPAYLPLTGGTINGNVTVNGTASIAFLNVTIESASVIYSSGSNVFGDSTQDTQTLVGTILVSGSQSITGSLNVSQGITGSLLGTSSWANYAQTASNILGGKAPHVPFFITDTTLATSSIYQSGSGTVIINQDAATTANPEALYVWQPSTSSFNVISGKGNLDNYLQLNIQNTNQGPDASSDIVATANNGNENTNYIDIGINSQNYAGFLGGPNDAYVYSAGENLWIGNYSDGKSVYFFNSSSENPLITLTPSNTVDVNTTLNAPDITGSLYGTASWALNVLSASHAVNSDFAGYAQSAGTAANGGVTQLIAGSGITLLPGTGVGNVTVIAGGGGSGVTILSGSNVTESFQNASTWAFTHSLGTRTPVISVFDSNYNQVIPESIQLVDTASAIITFPTLESGFAVATVGGVSANALSASYSLFSTYADTASYFVETDPVFVAKSASLATTGSNAFRGTQTISGSFNVSGSTAFNGNVTLLNGATGSLFGTASFATTASFVTGSIFSNGNLALSSSFASTASYALSSSYAANSDLLDGKDSTIFATTGSNIFIGNQTITGSLIVTGSSRLIGNQTITGSLLVTQSYISTVDYIDFTTTSTPAHLEGRIHWDTDTKTLQIDTDVNNFAIPTGHTSVLRGKNQNNFTLAKGLVVYISGEQGNTPTFATASWDTEIDSAYAIAIVAQDIGTNNNGYAVTNGILTGINTNAYAPSTLLYLSSSGQYTDIKPAAPKQGVRIGQVITQAINGSIYVKVDNGYEIGELHDVTDTTTTSSFGDLLVKSGSVWINSKQLTGSYAITGSLTVSGSGTFTNIGPTNFTGSVGITGSVTVAGNIVPTVSSSFSLGSIDNPWKEIFLKSGSISIESDVPGSPSTVLSNANGNILISAGGMQLLGSGSFNAATGSFGYISGSLTHVGTLNQDGAVTVSGSLTLSSGSALNINDGFYVNGTKQYNYGQFSSTTSQSGSVNVTSSFNYNTTVYSQGVSIVSGSRITIPHGGVYNITATTTVEITTNVTTNVYLWLRKNGNNVSDSTVFFRGRAVYHYLALNHVVSASAGDYFEVMKLYDADAPVFTAVAATGSVPAVPSIITTVTQVA